MKFPLFLFVVCGFIRTFVADNHKEENTMNKEKITQENFDAVYVDSIELQQIDKFVCKEMGRQIHRYIKAMKGSKVIMEKFEEAIANLSVPEKEIAIARYIDLNRKVISGLDMKVVLARAMANYCDTFNYFYKLIHDEQKMDFYLARIKEKYIRFHTVFEENGKFGIKDYKGELVVKPEYDFLRTCYAYVDDLNIMPIIAEKNGKLGLILPDRKDTVVADFIYDDISLRDEYPVFEARKGKTRGYLDKDGQFIRK